jgi:uncharacterized protein YjbI with pentapeptide repeats
MLYCEDIMPTGDNESLFSSLWSRLIGETMSHEKAQKALKERDGIHPQSFEKHYKSALSVGDIKELQASIVIAKAEGKLKELVNNPESIDKIGKLFLGNSAGKDGEKIVKIILNSFDDPNEQIGMIQKIRANLEEKKSSATLEYQKKDIEGALDLLDNREEKLKRIYFVQEYTPEQISEAKAKIEKNGFSDKTVDDAYRHALRTGNKELFNACITVVTSDLKSPKRLQALLTGDNSMPAFLHAVTHERKEYTDIVLSNITNPGKYLEKLQSKLDEFSKSDNPSFKLKEKDIKSINKFIEEEKGKLKANNLQDNKYIAKFQVPKQSVSTESTQPENLNQVTTQYSAVPEKTSVNQAPGSIISDIAPQKYIPTLGKIPKEQLKELIDSENQVAINSKINVPRLLMESGYELDLKGMDFSGMNLSNTEFNYEGEIKTRDQEGEYIYPDIKITQLDLSNCNFNGANLEDVDFGQANLEGAKLTNLQGNGLQGANLAGCNLKGIELSPHTNMQEANLSRANAEGVDFKGADLSDAHLIQTNLKSAKLIDANLTGSNIDRANFTNADLSHAHLIDVIFNEQRTENFEGVNFTDTQLERYVDGEKVIDDRLQTFAEASRITMMALDEPHEEGLIDDKSKESSIPKQEEAILTKTKFPTKTEDLFPVLKKEFEQRLKEDKSISKKEKASKLREYDNLMNKAIAAERENESSDARIKARKEFLEHHMNAYGTVEQKRKFAKALRLDEKLLDELLTDITKVEEKNLEQLLDDYKSSTSQLSKSQNNEEVEDPKPTIEKGKIEKLTQFLKQIGFNFKSKFLKENKQVVAKVNEELVIPARDGDKESDNKVSVPKPSVETKKEKKEDKRAQELYEDMYTRLADGEKPKPRHEPKEVEDIDLEDIPPIVSLPKKRDSRSPAPSQETKGSEAREEDLLGDRATIKKSGSLKNAEKYEEAMRIYKEKVSDRNQDKYVFAKEDKDGKGNRVVIWNHPSHKDDPTYQIKYTLDNSGEIIGVNAGKYTNAKVPPIKKHDKEGFVVVRYSNGEASAINNRGKHDPEIGEIIKDKTGQVNEENLKAKEEAYAARKPLKKGMNGESESISPQQDKRRKSGPSVPR